MSSKLALYNGALRKIGERKLTALTDDVEARHRLDDAYDDEFIDLVLSRANWNFAERTAQIAGSANAGLGYDFEFTKPSDFVRTVVIATDELFLNRLEQYEDAPSVWQSDVSTIYVRYISNDASYGGDLSLWPSNFAQYAEWVLAEHVCWALTNDKDILEVVAKGIKSSFEEAGRFDAQYRVVRPELDARQLRTYKGSLRKLGLPSLSEIPVELQYRMTEIWDDQFVDQVLQEGQWNFAIRTVKVDYDASIEPDFGYRYGFAKPSDWLRTVGVASDGHFYAPPEYYEDEGEYWWSDLQEMYIRYISNGSSYGTNYASWPEKFQQYVEWELAKQIQPIATTELSTKDAFALCERALMEARSVDSMNQPNKRPPVGSWAGARTQRFYRDDNNKRIR